MQPKEFEINEQGTLLRYNGDAQEVVIPPTIDGIPVRFIGQSAFFERSLYSVVIPEGVEHIGDYAFGESGVVRVAFPNSLISIRSMAFSGSCMRDLQLPQNLVYIGTGSFFCNSINSLTLPDSVVHIGKGAFAENFIKYIHFGKRLTIIKNGAFYGTDTLMIDIPANVILRRSAVEGDFDLVYSHHKKAGGRYMNDQARWWYAGALGEPDYTI